MKKFVLLSLINLCLWATPNWTASVQKAKAQAAASDKLIMVMLSKEACDACWYMENIVFDNTKVQAALKEDFIPVYINVKVNPVPDFLPYRGTPTFYFLNADGEVIAPRIEGSKNAKEFISDLKEVKKLTKP